MVFLLSPTNGNVIGSEYLEGDVVTYSCNTGYVLIGERASTCQADGTWDNENVTTCRAGNFYLKLTV